MHFLRSNRHASVIITVVVLVVVGLSVSVMRQDTPKTSGLVLRADEQSLQTQPTVTLPPAVRHAPPGQTSEVPDLTIPGAIGRPANKPTKSSGAPRAGSSTNDPTNTTAAPSSSPTTTPPSPGSAFGAGRIAYSLGGSAWSISPDGTDARIVAERAYFPAWSKDHSAIAVADADSPGGGLSLVTPAGERLGLTTGVADDAQPAWSPDGTKLAFARIDNTSQADYSAIWVIDRDGSDLHKIATPSPCFNRDPAWSPDGKKIAFWSSRDHCGGGPATGTYTLYVYDTAADATTPLGDAKTNRGGPGWSPDGKTIAFSSDGDGGVGFEICLMNADGSNVRQITNLSGDETDPSFSPDGKKIVFRSTRDGGSLYTMNANGSEIRLLVGGGVQPHWS